MAANLEKLAQEWKNEGHSEVANKISAIANLVRKKEILRSLIISDKGKSQENSLLVNRQRKASV